MSEQELLKDLKHIADALQANLPKQAAIFIPQDSLAATLDPLRILQLREACIHRVSELAESTYEAFNKGNRVAGYVLARAIYETVALFWCFVDRLEKSLETGDLEELRETLTRMVLGSKIDKVKESITDILKEAQEPLPKNLNPIYISDCIKEVAKQLPPFKEHYDFLCEVTHPNAMGLIKAYVRNDFQAGISCFGKEQGSLSSHLEKDLEALILVLESFIERYNHSGFLLIRFQKNCVSTYLSKATL
ncbi:MAG: hypothetical protein FJZ63_05090 [Chlamydiae bacterium]|nr:hypothetical protein [Chlamydiota bacterium]